VTPRAVLQVDGLVKHFPVRRGHPRAAYGGQVRAVDGVASTCRGETLGVVGESGCGKSPPAAWCCG
jgi:ABC-type oligopeptide transport system ATPase subunit